MLSVSNKMLSPFTAILFMRRLESGDLVTGCCASL